MGASCTSRSDANSAPAFPAALSRVSSGALVGAVHFGNRPWFFFCSRFFAASSCFPFFPRRVVAPAALTAVMAFHLAYLVFLLFPVFIPGMRPCAKLLAGRRRPPIPPPDRRPTFRWIPAANVTSCTVLHKGLDTKFSLKRFGRCSSCKRMN